MRCWPAWRRGVLAGAGPPEAARGKPRARQRQSPFAGLRAGSTGSRRSRRLGGVLAVGHGQCICQCQYAQFEHEPGGGRAPQGGLAFLSPRLTPRSLGRCGGGGWGLEHEEAKGVTRQPFPAGGNRGGTMRAAIDTRKRGIDRRREKERLSCQGQAYVTNMQTLRGTSTRARRCLAPTGGDGGAGLWNSAYDVRSWATVEPLGLYCNYGWRVNCEVDTRALLSCETRLCDGLLSPERHPTHVA